MTSRSPLWFVILLTLTACGSLHPELHLEPKNPSLAKRVSKLTRNTDCQFGVFALHLESGRKLEINSARPVESASVIKIAVLTEMMERSREGNLNLHDRWTLTTNALAADSEILNWFDQGLQPTLLDLARLMIGYSENTAANVLIDMFGKDQINARMARLGLSEIKLLGRIPDAEPENTQEQRWNALKLGSITPRAVGEYFRRLASGTLLDPSTDQLMLEMFRLQHYRQRIPKLLLGRPGVKWAGKTGTMNGMFNDSGILETNKGHFILVVLAQCPNDDSPLTAARAQTAIAEIAQVIVTTWEKTLRDVHY